MAHLVRVSIHDILMEKYSEDSELDEDIVLETIGSDSDICSESNEDSPDSNVDITYKIFKNITSTRLGRNITKKTYDD